MRVIHVVPSIANEASGPSYSVPALCRGLAESGAAIQLHVLGAADQASRSLEVVPYPSWRMVSQLGIAPQMLRGLTRAARSADVIHNHSLWMMPNVYAASAARDTSCKLVVSPRGTLSSWALRRNRWPKRIMWSLGQGRAVRAAHCIHATAESELADIRSLGLRNPVAVIPNGIHIPELPERGLRRGLRKLLFLGRIHPKKGIDILLQAWRAVQQDYQSWELEICGPDNDGHLLQMQQFADEIGVERVRFGGAVYGPEKESCYQAAELFVLPTHSENFGLTVAEALANGVPAVVTRGAPWAGLVENNCGWWIDCGVEPLVEALRGAMALPAQDLKYRGACGRAWMERDFSWERIGDMMYETYGWLVGGGTPPSWVVLD